MKALGKIFGRFVPTQVELHASETCPACGSRLARNAAGWGERPREPLTSQGGSPGVSPHQPVVWHCPNPDCPPQVLLRVARWVSPEAMDIPSCNAALVAQLVNRGLVRDAAEFYQLRPAELAALEGMDEPRARTLWEEITASKQREAWRILSGLGIPQVGAAEAQALCRHFATLDALFATGREQLLQRARVSEPVARSLTHWYADSVNRRLVKRLEKAGLNFRCASP